MFPVRCRLAGLGAMAIIVPDDALLAHWDASFARVYHDPGYADHQRRVEALENARPAAVARITAALPYKGYHIRGVFVSGGRALQWHLLRGDDAPAIFDTPDAARAAVDAAIQQRQQAEVRQWSDDRVNAHAAARGLPTLDLLKAAGEVEGGVLPVNIPEQSASPLVPLLIGGAALAAVTILAK